VAPCNFLPLKWASSTFISSTSTPTEAPKHIEL
jgi:hypothetical protein